MTKLYLNGIEAFHSTSPYYGGCLILTINMHNTTLEDFFL